VPKIKTELIKQPKEGQQYTIKKVEEVTIEIRNNDYDAYRVEMKSTDTKDTSLYSISLWSSETSGSTSKLGSFLDAFQMFFKGSKDAYETDNWVGHIIQFNTWKDRDRDIQVIS